jgi:predicted hotdog family 3-hydroxylacyl-ACP dehydratase
MLYSGERLIPNRPPMLFIDGVSLSAESAQACAVVGADWIILDAEGRLHPAAFFELMAQGFAAICSARLQAENREFSPPFLGFLVGVKNFQVYGTAVAGDRLTVGIPKQTAVDRFHVFEAVVKNDREELLASGQIKVFLADEGVLEDAGTPLP